MFREMASLTARQRSLDFRLAPQKHMKTAVSYSRQYGSFEKCSETLTTNSQTLKAICKTNNPIAYNLKQLKYHESDQT